MEGLNRSVQEKKLLHGRVTSEIVRVCGEAGSEGGVEEGGAEDCGCGGEL